VRVFRADRLEQREKNAMSGRVVHFEIPFADGERARSFYQSAFWWSLMPLTEMSYTMVSTGPMTTQGPTEPGYIGGGMMARTEHFQGPVIIVDVDDIESALATVEQLGGATGAIPSGGRPDGLYRLLDRP
jgi:predicted enzyme related to lactoylglutathione lyase